MSLTDGATAFMKLWDWVSKKETQAKLIILLVFVVGAFLAYFIKNELDEAREIGELRAKVLDCSKVKTDLEKARLNTILIQANTDYAPNAQWLTDATTGNVLWINKAYEKKYLKPLGKSAKDLLGTDGSGIFGQEKADLFKRSNNLVLYYKRPMIFNELTPTLKFEVKLGDFTYAVGGMEYEQFE